MFSNEDVVLDIEILKKRISQVRGAKVKAQTALRNKAAKPQLPPILICAEESDSDCLDWTAEEWTKKEPVWQGSTLLGYRNVDELAEATYKKEISKRTADQDKYNKAMQADLSTPSYAAVLAPEDIEALVQGLREATERRQKRRRVGDGGLYMNERNRQFNLKLDREYGDNDS